MADILIEDIIEWIDELIIFASLADEENIDHTAKALADATIRASRDPATREKLKTLILRAKETIA